MSAPAHTLLYDARRASDGTAEGAARGELLRAMAPLLAPGEMLHVLVSRPGELPFLDGNPQVMRHVADAPDDSLRGVWQAFRLALGIQAEIVHAPSSTFLLRGPGRPVADMPPIVMDGDAGRVQLGTGLLERWRNFRLVSRARRIFAPAETARPVIGRLLGPNGARRLLVIPPGVDTKTYHPIGPAAAAAFRAAYHLPEKYLLIAGPDRPVRNLMTVIRALTLMDSTETLPLVVLAPGNRRLSPVRHEVERRELDDCFFPLESVPAADRPALFASAHLFLDPGLADGSHLDALAAMASGTPVIAAALPGARALLGEAVKLVHPTDPMEWARALRAALISLEWHDAVRAKGLAATACLDWPCAAAATLAAYRQLYRREFRLFRRPRAD